MSSDPDGKERNKKKRKKRRGKSSVHRGNGIIIVTGVVKGGTKAEEKQNGVS